jgi:hypothetical protein
MKHVLVITAVLFVAQMLACGQQPLAHAQSALLTIDDGVIANGSYSNDCAGISFPIPKGGKVTKRFAGNLPQIRAKRVAANIHLLLTITRDTGRQFPDWFALNAIDVRGAKPSVHDFVSQFARSDMRRNNDLYWELIRDGFSFELGGRHYSRSDYMRSFPNGEVYHSYVATSFRYYFFVWEVMSSSPASVDQWLASFQSIEFRENRSNPLCDPFRTEKTAP